MLEIALTGSAAPPTTEAITATPTSSDTRRCNGRLR
jgi:hypothetical protein